MERTPHAFGTLRNSMHGNVTASALAIRGQVVTASPYGAAVEFGSKPHWPPIGPLELWVKRKFAGKGSMMQLEAHDIARIQRRDVSLALSRGRFAGRHALAEGDVKEKMIRQAAFLVARKISRVGTKGHHMFGKGWAASVSNVERMLEAAFQRFVERLKGL